MGTQQLHPEHRVIPGIQVEQENPDIADSAVKVDTQDSADCPDTVDFVGFLDTLASVDCPVIQGFAVYLVTADTVVFQVTADFQQPVQGHPVIPDSVDFRVIPDSVA